MKTMKMFEVATLITGGAGLGFAKDSPAKEAKMPAAKDPAAREQTGAPKEQGMNHETMAPAMGSDAARLQQDMRRLWTDHAVWTREYIVAAVADLGDQKPIVDRLMKNQDEIGAAIAPYYGKAAGDQLAKLLREHISGAADVVKAAKSGNKATLQEVDAKWHKNGQEIADFLSKANPSNWQQVTLRQMMDTHLAQVNYEATTRLDKKWEDNVRAFDTGYTHILGMADALSDGIIKQFPDKFNAPKVGKR
jgi:hypothetical protein